MKKIGVITYYATNYGAFLQAYALQQYLMERGHEPELIHYDYYHDHAILGISYVNIKNPIKFVASVGKRILKMRSGREKERVFAKAVEEKLHVSEKTYSSYKQLVENPPKYDIYLTGSDQIWNPNINSQAFESRLLNFVQDNQAVKMSYAASVGVTKLSEATKCRMRQALRLFSGISVREEMAQKIVSELTDQKILRNCDPTLLLDQEKWLEFCEPCPIVPPFIFVYMLEQQPELIAYVETLSRKTGLTVLSMGNGKFANEMKHRILNPMEFISALSQAEYVVANSFHALVFSVIFKKRIRVFYPAHVSERLRELVVRCNIELITRDYDMELCNVEELYENCEKIMETEKIEANEYFRNIEELI